MFQSITCRIEPMGKPRMTRGDRWKKRECVSKYWAFKDELKILTKGIDLKGIYCVNWRVYFSMPKSWTKKKKAEMKGKRHQQKPDRDNIDKAILDALFSDDSKISDGRLQKFWDDGLGTRIYLSFEKEDINE